MSFRHLLIPAIFLLTFCNSITGQNGAKFYGDSLKGFDEKGFKAAAQAEGLSGADFKWYMDGQKRNYINEKYDLLDPNAQYTFPGFFGKNLGGTNQVLAAPCTNEDFENGTLSGWTMSLATNVNSQQYPTFTGSVNATHTAVVITPHTDDIIGNIPNSPLGGSFVAVINNSLINTGAPVVRLSQTFPVTSTNYIYDFAYWAVMQDAPAHSCTATPYMSVRVRNNGTLTPCPNFSIIAPGSSGGCAGVGPLSWTTVNGNGVTVRTSNGWQRYSIDLSQFSGPVTIEVMVSHCNIAGHFGYAYFDSNCGQFNLRVNGTTTVNMPTSNVNVQVPCASTATMVAPLGFNPYSWNGPTGTSTSGTLVTTAAGIYSLNMNPLGSCAPGINRFINLKFAPPVIVSASPATICAAGTNTSSTLSASGASSYLWSTGQTTSTISVSPSVTTIYTVTATSGTCVGTFTVQVNIATPPTINISASSTTVCSGPNGTVTLTGSGGNTYIWNPGSINGNPVTVTPPSPVIPATSLVTTYTVLGINAQGCGGTNTIAIKVEATPPVAAFKFPATGSVCIGDPVLLVGSGAQGSNYTWTPGGQIGNVVSEFPLANTIYTVQGTYFGGICIGTATVQALVDPGPPISVVASPTITCPGITATLTATSPLAVGSISWNPGAGTGTTFTVNPLVTTTYSVNANNLAGCGRTVTIVKLVAPSPTISFAPTTPTLCFGSALTLTASGGTSYTWTAPAPVVNTNTKTVSPTVNTAYFVSVNNGSCTSNSSVMVTVIPNPTVNASVNPTAICVGETATLSGTGANTWNWLPGGMTTASPVVSPSGNTTYTVTGTTAGCSNTKTVSLIVHALPTITVARTPTAVCPGLCSTLTPSGALSYTFLNGGPVVCPSVTTTYSVLGTSSLGCESALPGTVSVVVSPIPLISLNPSSATICVGGTVQVVASGAIAYTWNPIGLFTATVVLSPTVTTTYTVTGRNLAGCTRDRTITITVNLNPTISATAAPPSICIGASSTLTALGATSYSWYPGGTTGNPISVTPTSSITYTVIGSSLGCRDTANVLVTVNPRPSISVAANPTAVCVGVCATLTPTGASTYTFLNGGPVVCPSVTTTYSVSGTSALGCVSSTPGVRTIVVNPAPSISATPSSTSICAGQSVSIILTGGITYTTMPGGINGSNLNLSPVISTIYTVSGTSAGGCIGTTTINITVNPVPVLTASASPAAVCLGNSSTLTASGATSFVWQPGGATGSPVVVTPSVTTIYTVSGTSLGCAGTRTVLVTVNPRPTIGVSATPGTVCAGSCATLAPSGALTYTFINGGPVVCPSVTTSYSVTGTNAFGCPAINPGVVTIVVNPLPNVFAVASSANICAGSTVTLSAGNASTYTWQPVNLTGQSITVTPVANTTYTVFGTASGCIGQATVAVNVLPIPTITATASPATICRGGTSLLSASGASTYVWNPGGSTSNPASVSPTATTIYTVTGTSFGCSGTRTVLVTVNPLPTITAVSNPPAICNGTCATLSPSGAVTYTYLNGGPVVCPTSNTTYSIMGTNAFNCVSALPGTVFVTVNPLPSIFINASNDTICAGSIATMTASGASSYTWQPINVTGSVVSVSPVATTVYTVTGQSAAGCRSQNTFTIRVNPLPVVGASASPATICRGATSILTATGATSYVWNPGSLVGSTVGVSPTITTVYTVTGTLNGCIGTRTVQVTVNPRPTIGVAANPTAVCPGGCSTLTPSGAVTYTFMNGGPIVCPSVTTTYSVMGTSSLGCVSSAPGTVTVIRNSNPTIFATATPTQICAGQSTTLFAGGAVTFTWFPGGATGSSVIVTPLVSTNYTVFGTAGCTGSTVLSIVVNPLPLVNASASPATICRGQSSILNATGASSYVWQPGNSPGSSFTVTPIATTIYTVTGTSAAGCSASRTVIVNVNPTPTISVVANATAVCAGSCVTLTPGGAITYTYLNGGPVVCPLSTTTYSVAGTNAFGCVSQVPAVIQINVNPIPSITVTPSSTAICVGSVLSASASGANSYLWMPGNLSGANVTVSPASTTIYTITGNSLGCTSTRTMAVTVNPKPNVIAFANPPIICSGASTSLTATGALSFVWTPGPLSGSLVVVSPIVNTAYFVTGTNTFGCTDTKTVTVIVNPVPSVSISASSSSICSGSSATLTGSGAIGYLWFPGAIAGPTRIVTPSITTTYTLVGSNGFGCSDTEFFTLNVVPTPTINLSATSPSICQGFTVGITATGANNFTWNPGGSTGNFLFDQPGVTTTYTATGESGGCTSSKTITILVVPLPNITATAIPSTICAGQTVTLSAFGGITYTWLPTFTTGATVTDIPSVSTTYTVVGQAANGCPNYAIVAVSVNQPPVINASSSSPSICIGTTATLTATGGNNYTWTPGPQFTNPVVVNPTSGTTYTVIGDNGSCTGSTTIFVGVNPLPVINANASPPSVCAGSPVSLSASGASNYTWQPINQVGATVVDLPVTATTYTVFGEDFNGCINSAITSVAVNPLPVIFASASSTALCEGTQVTLTASGAGSYTWEPGTMIGQVVNDTPLTSTLYTVTGTDGNGCTGAGTIQIMVYPNPTVIVSPLNSSVCIGSGATLTATGANSYTWFPSLTTGPVITEFPTVSTIYTVTGDNGGICFHTTTVQVFVNPLPAGVTASVSGTITCASPTVQLFGSSTDVTVNYSWNGPQNYSSGIQNPTGVTAWGIYTLNVTDINTGCVATATVDVPTDGSIPLVTPIASGSITCATATVFLNAVNSTTNPSYTWMGPNNFAANTVTAEVTVAGDYTVIVRDLTSGCSDTAVVTVGTHTEVTITATIVPATCSAGSSNNDGTIMVSGFGGKDKFDLVAGTSYTGSATYVSAVVIPTSGIITNNLANPNDTVYYSMRIFDSLGCQKDFVLKLIPVDCSLRSLGLAKSVATPTANSDGSYDVQYTIIARNYDTGPLNAVVITENLSLAFPSPSTFTVMSVNGSVNNNLIVNTAFDGITQTNLTQITSTLLGTSVDTVRFTVRVAVNGFFGPYNNNVSGTSINNINVVVTDVSTDGSDPDPDLDGDPKDNSDPTIITFTPNLFFGLTKQGSFLALDNESYDITYTITVHNLGNDTLSNVVVSDSLFKNTIKQPATYTIKSGPGATGDLIANAGFNGNDDINLLSPGSKLAPLSIGQITFVINVVPDTVSVISNTAMGTAFNALTNSTLTDISNNGIDPDSNDNGVWNEDDDNVPTIIVLPNPAARTGTLFIPQGFSPDNDGINDLWVIKNLPTDGDNTVTIYNRWGNRVYYHANYNNLWDGYPNIAGTVGKGKLPQGTYYFVLEMKNSGQKPVTGFIELQYKD